MTLNWHTSRSSKLHVSYWENGDRYNDYVSKSRIGSQPFVHWQHEFWLWMTLNCPRSEIFAANISNVVADTVLDLKEVRWQTIYGLSIGTINFDPGWPWTALVWKMGLETACVWQIHIPWFFQWRNQKWFTRMCVISLPVFTNLLKMWINVFKQWFTGEMLASYRNSGSLNPFLVTNMRLKIELMYLLRMRMVTKVAENGIARRLYS